MEVVDNNGESRFIPKELLREILQRFPAITLTRFKQVSKHWSSLILQPDFASDHAKSCNYASAPFGLVLCSNWNPCLYVPISPPENGNIIHMALSKLREVSGILKCSISLVQSCNGLLLCKLSSQVKSFPAENHFVYNPARVDITIIPNPRKTLGLCFQLVFDPSQSSEFSVFCLTGHEILVYSSKEKLWTSYYNFNEPPNTQSEMGVHYDGGIYWLRDDDILRFDIKSKQVTHLRKAWDEEWGVPGYLVESGGYLHLIERPTALALLFRIYELVNEDFTWVRKWTVNVFDMIRQFPEMNCKKYSSGRLAINYSVLVVVREEREEDSTVILAIPGKVIEYNLGSRSVRKIGDFPLGKEKKGKRKEKKFDAGSFTAHRYIATLSPLEGPVKADTTPKDFCKLNDGFCETLFDLWEAREKVRSVQH